MPRSPIAKFGRESVVKVRHCSKVPRITGCGACKKGEPVVDEIGDDQFHNLLWEPGGLGWTCGWRPGGGPPLRGFGFPPVPELVSEECDHCSMMVNRCDNEWPIESGLPVSRNVGVFANGIAVLVRGYATIGAGTSLHIRYMLIHFRKTWPTNSYRSGNFPPRATLRPHPSSRASSAGDIDLQDSTGSRMHVDTCQLPQ